MFTATRFVIYGLSPKLEISGYVQFPHFDKVNSGYLRQIIASFSREEVKSDRC